MQIKNIAKVTLLAAGIIGLAACSSTKKPTTGEGVDAMGTQTFGLGSSVDYRSLKGPYSSSAVAGESQSFYFDYDKNIVQAMYLPDLQIHANYLISNPNTKVKLEGNTDARGSREYNIALGWRRADAVAKILEMDGVPKKQIEEVSYGAERPFANGTTDQDYQLNRRVDLIYGK